MVEVTRVLSRCRICQSERAVAVGTVEYISGYAWDVEDCEGCGCRLTRHSSSVHNVMHETGGVSYYSEYRAFGKQCQQYFSRNDGDGLESALIKSSKYKFVIDEVARCAEARTLLEYGASHGYLTSYFILGGYDVLGVDVSPEAIARARSNFGDYFAGVGDPRIDAGGPYDFIYHVGLIGCVGDPVGLTRELIGRLKPGGRLVFNAPNRAALSLNGQLWLDSAPPPDLVTLFSKGFWSQQFSDVAVVEEIEETVPPRQALAVGMRRLFGWRWRNPVAKDLREAGAGGHVWSQDFGAAWRLFERVCVKAGSVTGLDRLAPSHPTDFGLFVTMERR